MALSVKTGSFGNGNGGGIEGTEFIGEYELTVNQYGNWGANFDKAIDKGVYLYVISAQNNVSKKFLNYMCAGSGEVTTGANSTIMYNSVKASYSETHDQYFLGIQTEKEGLCVCNISTTGFGIIFLRGVGLRRDIKNTVKLYKIKAPSII